MEKQKLITPEQIQEDMSTLMLEIDQEVEESKKELEKLTSESTALLSKKSKLEELGFFRSSSFKKAKSVEDQISEKQKLAGIVKREKELINKYKIKYPGYKFIPERIFTKVLEKYDIYTSQVSNFTGDVPTKAVNDIIKFKESYYKEEYEVIETFANRLTFETIERITFLGSEKDCFNYKARRDAELSRRSTSYHDRTRYLVKKKPFPIRISAPINEFDLSDKAGFITSIVGRNIEEIKVDDPIVTHPVEGGHIVITAWGQEALDEEVLNSEHN